MKYKNKGFTLIELMIVIAIIGILMAYAIPAYRSYTIKAKRGECHSISTRLKSAIAIEHSVTGIFPADLTEIGINSNFSTTNITSIIMVGSGDVNVEITCEFNNPAGGGSVTYEGTEVGGTYYWTCADSLGSSSASQICQ
jgi:prepilin-type N-terminal cleavage/methylation domain-containing protein